MQPDKRKIIRGIIPSDVQAQIRKACPTTDFDDLVPTGFPPCDLQSIDFGRMTALFEPLRDDTSIQNILTYRHSQIGVMLQLFHQQVTFGDEVLAQIEYRVAPTTLLMPVDSKTGEMK